MSILAVLALVSLVQCGFTAPLAMNVHDSEAAGFGLKQRFAYRIGQVQCLKALLTGENIKTSQFGLSSLHGGNYSQHISRQNLRQHIAYLLGQVKCLRIHLNDSDIKPAARGPLHAIHSDCRDAYQKGHTTDGVYTINPDNQTPFKVYCDMTTTGGGWAVIQRRMDGSVDFYRNWADYEQGFGKPTGEYWLGLRDIHRLTISAVQELRVDLEDFQGQTRYAYYSDFSVAGTNDKYRMTAAGYAGTAGEALAATHSGQQFSTKDNDNDQASGNCATHYTGAWWYNNCLKSGLNGHYYATGIANYKGLCWSTWKANSMRKTAMKVRRR